MCFHVSVALHLIENRSICYYRCIITFPLHSTINVFAHSLSISLKGSRPFTQNIFSAPNLTHSLVRAVQSERLIPQTGIESIFFACSVKDVEEDINKCPAAPSPVHASVGRYIA